MPLELGQLLRKEQPVRRAFIDLSPFVIASLVIAAGALMVGGNLTLAPPPVPAYVSQRPGCLDAAVFPMAGSSVKGQARLCIVDEGVRPIVDIEGLTPGTAYVTWFGYIDRPELCQTPRCALDDLLGETAEGVSGRMDSVVADGIRKAQFAGDFRDIRLRSESQALIFIFERGAVTAGDTRGRARQLLTVRLPGLDLPETYAGDGTGHVVARAIFDLP